MFRILHPGFRPTLRQHFNRLLNAVFTVLWTPWRRTFMVDFMSPTGGKRYACLQRHSLASAIHEAKTQRRSGEVIWVRPVPLAQHMEIFDPRGELPTAAGL